MDNNLLEIGDASFFASLNDPNATPDFISNNQITLSLNKSVIDQLNNDTPSSYYIAAGGAVGVGGGGGVAGAITHGCSDNLCGPGGGGNTYACPRPSISCSCDCPPEPCHEWVATYVCTW